jgi:5-keto-L-gluconate epimerase
MPKVSLAIQTPDVETVIPVALLSGTLVEKFEKASQFGAQGIEFITVQPKSLESAWIRSQLSIFHLQPTAVASGGLAFAAGITLIHPDPLRASQARNRLLQLIDFAAEIGAPLVTIGSFRGKLASVGSQARDILSQILFQAAQYAARQDVRLVIEPLNRYETDLLTTAQQTLEFIQEVGHAHIGLLLDTYHMNIEESSWAAPFEAASAAGKLWHIHLGDNNRLPPGKGMIDFAKILTILDTCGYRGFLSAELLARPDPDQAAVQTIQHIRSLSGVEPCA